MADSTLTNKVYTLTHSIANDLCKYQYPLSLRVPSNSWTSANVMQGEKELKCSILDGYIYFDAIPNGGDIIVSVSTGMENIPSDPAQRTKLLHEGMLYILRPDGKVYTAQGAEVR